MGTVRSSTPTSLPVSVSDAKEHLRVTDDEEDAYIRALIMAARDYAETATRQQLVSRDYAETLDNFPATIELSRWPVSTVASIGYRDENGSSQVVASTAYQVDYTESPSRIVPSVNDSWPMTQTGRLNAVTIAYTAGPSTAGTFDFRARAGMLMLVGHWYRNREEVVVGAMPTKIPDGAKWLFQSMRTGTYP